MALWFALLMVRVLLGPPSNVRVKIWPLALASLDCKFFGRGNVPSHMFGSAMDIVGPTVIQINKIKTQPCGGGSRERHHPRRTAEGILHLEDWIPSWANNSRKSTPAATPPEVAVYSALHMQLAPVANVYGAGRPSSTLGSTGAAAVPCCWTGV